MSDSKLSADAFNVMKAATNGNACLIDDPVYKQCVANGIRAAVDAVLPANDCSGLNEIRIRLEFLSLVARLTSAHQGDQPWPTT